MKLDPISPSLYQVTLHAYELAALMAAARWVVQGAGGVLPAEARDQLGSLLKRYDAEIERIRASKG